METLAAREQDLQISMQRALKTFQKKILPVSFVLPITGWVNDTAETSDYKYYYEVAVSNLTAKDVVNVNIALDSLATAEDCGLCQTSKTFANKFRVYAKNIPTSAINIEYYVLEGES